MQGPVAVLGLGLMGSRMAASLMAHGLAVRGFDPDPARCEELVARGGTMAASPAEAVEGCWAAVLSLPDSTYSREVCLGPGGIASAPSPGLHVYDTTTGTPGDGEEIATELAGFGVTYCDTTVSGNSAIAERGELVVMMGGPVESYRIGEPIFAAIGRSHHHVGPVGSAARMKLVVNHVLGINRLAIAEALVVAELAGMDLDVTLAVLKDGLAYSKAMDAWGDRMVRGDHANPHSRLRQSHKDARLIVEHGESLGAPVDLEEVVRAVFEEGESMGLADLDNSAVMEVVRRRAGIGRVS